ncbi:hypothetical protein L596_030763 [Steinernema carpocapsae]|uniref:Uncharacterized protein n=1 Tax=Steinernema carpocapsae TaxID=34508 RepID=A0A4U5LNP9_STECR|nr:hypothetical protein L596_030763 [Steinernema carpocapsae]
MAVGLVQFGSVPVWFRSNKQHFRISSKWVILFAGCAHSKVSKKMSPRLNNHEVLNIYEYLRALVPNWNRTGTEH